MVIKERNPLLHCKKAQAQNDITCAKAHDLKLQEKCNLN